MCRGSTSTHTGRPSTSICSSTPLTPTSSERAERGSLLELAWNGAEPVVLADGRERTFLEDGDEVVLRGLAGDGDAAVALAEVRGRIVAG